MSILGYCTHLREQAPASGGESGADARARLGAAQADLIEARPEQLRGELVEAVIAFAGIGSPYRDQFAKFIEEQGSQITDQHGYRVRLGRAQIRPLLEAGRRHVLRSNPERQQERADPEPGHGAQPDAGRAS